jgi:hypothetical protein
MSSENESPLDRLWQEHGQLFRQFDDSSLARWMAQTLGQLRGRAWRFSHPLVGAYRLAAQVGHDRQVWLKRLANPPSVYADAECCRAPLLPLVTRDILESGLICQHCSATVLPLEELPEDLQPRLREWAEAYAPVHAVAHWDDEQQRAARDYDQAYERAAKRAEQLLAQLGSELAPALLDHFPAVIWEDQDECLEVRPEDIPLG